MLQSSGAGLELGIAVPIYWALHSTRVLACSGLQGPYIRMGGEGTDGPCMRALPCTLGRRDIAPFLPLEGLEIHMQDPCSLHCGTRAGFPGSPEVGIGEFYCNSLMGVMSTTSLLSPAAAVSPLGSTAVAQGGGWLLHVAALNCLFDTGHPQNILPKGKKKI